MTYNIIEEFKDANALLEGHFVLSSGRHSRVFLQKNLVMMYPDRAERACKALAEKIKAQFGTVDAIISPAVGGIIPGYETARHLNCRAMFVERQDGVFKLRRGFEIAPQERIVMVEDIVTTGLSSRECFAALENHQGNILGAACLIDRSAGKAEIGYPLVSLAQYEITSYDPDNLPSDLQNTPAIKPGSRAL